MDWVFAILLFLHVMGAIIAFGPTFAFPILGPMAGREPQHAPFAVRFQLAVARRLIVPLALLQGVTGLLLVWKIGFEILGRGWLLAGIALYLVALVLSIGIGLPNVRRLADALATPPPPPEPGAEARHGPPPHIAAMIAKGRKVGMAQAVLIVLIVFLMVTKPF
ncbi:MAG: DUF2269 family protein [Candidatus Limnocylindrales bacterium]